MGRKPKFEAHHFIEAALDILAGQGPGGVTVKAVADHIGAPIGSVYHRFSSRDALLAEMWVRIVESFQKGFLEKLSAGSGLEAALYTPRWTRKHLKEGRVLLLYRREELMAGPWPEELRGRVSQLAAELDQGLKNYAQKRFGRTAGPDLPRLVFALIDVPGAAVRRYLETGHEPPEYVDDLVREAYLALLGEES